ncbi:MAG: CinA family protein [Corynebacterium sp.]|nr:CinA family protein [Corynebacterium sp.]
MHRDEALSSAAADVIRTLTSRGETIATCESLTAGLLSATLASVPGASTALRGGLVTYATDLKKSLAHVSAYLIDNHTVISAEVARAMAFGARQQCGSDWAIALTGVAGPDMQDGRAVGTVFMGVAGPLNAAAFQLSSSAARDGDLFTGGRNAIRSSVVERALEEFCEFIDHQGTK